jgi:hypothetical protein
MAAGTPGSRDPARPTILGCRELQPRTVNLRLAGVGSALPAELIARTLKTCLPTFSPLYFFGDLHFLNLPLSSLHWKVDPLTLEVNLKVAVVLCDFAFGPLLILVSGVGTGGGWTTAHFGPAAGQRCRRR